MTKVVRPFIDLVQRLLQLALGRGVERAGRLVEDQDRRVLEQRPGDRQALALAAGQRAAALADRRCRGPSAWRAMNSSAWARSSASIISSSVASGRPTCRFSRIERANSIGSWNTTPILRRSEDRREVADVVAVDADRARLRIEGAVQQARASSTCPSRSRRRGRSSRRAATAKETSCTAGALAVIGEAHVLEGDGAARSARRSSASGLVVHGRRGVEDLEELAASSAPA